MILHRFISWKFHWISALVWGSLIITLSLMPGGRGEMLIFGIPHFDKVGHFGMYGIWAFFVFIAFRSGQSFSGKAFWLAVSITTLTGIILEYGQFAFASGRSYELADMVANMFGAIAGVLAGKWLERQVLKNR